MMTTEQPPRNVSVDSVVVRALSSITAQQAEVIAGVVHATRPDWDVQTAVDYDGYLSLLVGPEINDDEQNTLFVAGTVNRLELSRLQGDNMTPVGIFPHVGPLLAALRDLLRHQ